MGTGTIKMHPIKEAKLLAMNQKALTEPVEKNRA